ncbi:MAG: hypothetical protein ACLUSM_11405 [Enterococcus avium]|nr:MAG TPA: Alpha-(1->3)-arabinofuranosyltransferase [Caudoviricetes sp.]
MSSKLSKKEVLKMLLFLAIVVFLMMSIQVYKKAIFLGDDITFHYQRFYEMYMQIKNGNLNYFQSIYSFNSSGRIINALYGYDFAFIQGIILSIFRSWAKFQIVSSFLCFYTSGVSMYFLARTIKLSPKFSFIGSVMYMTTSVVSSYPLYQAFNGWGAAFVPLLFIPAIKSVVDSKERINPVYLAIPVSILLSVHTLSALIGVLAIIPFYIVSFLLEKNKLRWIKNGFIAVLLALLLVANTIFSYIDVYSSNKIYGPTLIQKMSDFSAIPTLGGNDLKSLGLVVSIVFIFQIAYSILNWNKYPLIYKLINSVGIVFLVLSSTIIPWDALAARLDFLQVLQFPHRFLMIPYVLLLLGFLITISDLYSKLGEANKSVLFSIAVTIAGLMVFGLNSAITNKTTIWFSDSPQNNGNNGYALRERNPQKIRDGFKDKDLTKAFEIVVKGTSDYLPMPENEDAEDLLNKGPYGMYYREIVDNQKGYKRKISDNGSIILSWENTTGKTEEKVVPVIIYGHSVVKLNGSEIKPTELSKTEIGVAKVKSIPGRNELVVGYKPLISMKIAFALKMIGLISSVLFLFLNNNKKRKH